jgi:hypothetical protein
MIRSPGYRRDASRFARKEGSRRESGVSAQFACALLD